MPELSESQIARMISEGIHVPLERLCQALGKGEASDGHNIQEMFDFENVVAKIIGKAIVDAMTNGVTHEDRGSKWLYRVYHRTCTHDC